MNHKCKKKYGKRDNHNIGGKRDRWGIGRKAVKGRILFSLPLKKGNSGFNMRLRRELSRTGISSG
jgi:hypothetical protein